MQNHSNNEGPSKAFMDALTVSDVAHRQAMRRVAEAREEESKDKGDIKNKTA